jgi:hypothetical protein
MLINKIDKALEENAVKGLDEKLDALKEKKGASQETRLGYLGQLNVGYNQYAGTVPPAVVQQRRRKNKEARRARRKGRK